MPQKCLLQLFVTFFATEAIPMPNISLRFDFFHLEYDFATAATIFFSTRFRCCLIATLLFCGKIKTLKLLKKHESGGAILIFLRM
jgi:hypothetical protein